MKVASYLLHSTDASSVLQLLLASLATNTQGGRGRRYNWDQGARMRSCLPHCPFIASPFGTRSLPGSPGSSLLVLFPTVCPSVILSCVV